MRHQENSEFYEQISKHPLFRGTTSQEFAQLMEHCTLRHYEKSEKVLYSKTPREGLLLILDGMAEVLIAGDNIHQSQEVLEILQTGDIIGFSSLADFLGEPTNHNYNYTVEVQAVDNTDCLHIPYTVLEERWHIDDVRDFVLRQVAVRLKDIYASLAEQVQLANQWGESDAFIQRIQDVMTSPVISVQVTDPIHEVASLMVSKAISSVIVMNKETLAGIITEKDLVARVVSKNRPLDRPASEIMTENPITIQRDAYYYEALSTLLMNGVKHLPVLNGERVVGVVTLSHLLRKKNRGMMQVLQTIEESTYENLPSVKNAIYEVLSTLIHDEVPTIHTLEVITKLYDRLVKHCVDLAIASLKAQGKGEPPVAFCWYQMGSGGRGEQFLLTDQDHFLVYQDCDSEQDQQVANDYFALLGQEIVNQLEKAGYVQCIGKNMSNEDVWRGSLTKWRDRIRGWSLRATNENVLLGHNFYSYRFLYGDPSLHDQFIEMIKGQLSKARIFFYRMAQMEKDHPVPSLDHPIRALFRLEKDSIDIKKNALFPLHHCIQLLAIQNGIFEGTPLQKIDRLVSKKVFTEAQADDLRFAYEVVLGIRVNQTWAKFKRNEKGSSKIKFTHLKSREKEQLIRALKIIKTLQNQVLAVFAM
ncbi:DUF294 nucleotidyltransferase-like domain-containing protein [Anaerobacillus sp. MEB173]|uniref:DUF294 nucleotidyltransferase-like domain-containing protein n=1 Tax=Anaerobacillus sp. MEB173 TaxID=3383345 RepID=UPI003F901D5B